MQASDSMSTISVLSPRFARRVQPYVQRMFKTPTWNRSRQLMKSACTISAISQACRCMDSSIFPRLLPSLRCLHQQQGFAIRFRCGRNVLNRGKVDVGQLQLQHISLEIGCYKPSLWALSESLQYVETWFSSVQYEQTAFPNGHRSMCGFIIR